MRTSARNKSPKDCLGASRLIMRDLFQSDDGGWLEHVALLERLVAGIGSRQRSTSTIRGLAAGGPYGGHWTTRERSCVSRHL
ncbi:MAG: hypothetical protein FJX45_11520 [Alphaproteobacteria bacterium]|nr:hypothetical protein [Alphaproteobacteria bacterium]MBM3652377.1 hypothetical protein [Alphaproteobacteria bacterium]